MEESGPQMVGLSGKYDVETKDLCVDAVIEGLYIDMPIEVTKK